LATISRILKNNSFFAKEPLKRDLYFAKETYLLKELQNVSTPYIVCVQLVGPKISPFALKGKTFVEATHGGDHS